MPTYGLGTSFACPIIAGLTTCLWEAFPEVRNMDIVNTLRMASNAYTNPGDSLGYGIPDIKKAFVLLIEKLHSFQNSIAGSQLSLTWTAKSATGMNFVLERKLPTDASYQPIDTQYANGPFQSNTFTYTDNLSSLNSFTGFSYRIIMNIGSDTSFTLDSLIFPEPQQTISMNPNPVTDNLTVTVIRNYPSNVDIVIYNTKGQKIYTSENQQTAGVQAYTIPFEQESAGVYFVSVFINNNKEFTKTIVKP